jgi:lactoylglutathione lyase/glyoxylase I family protein
MPANPPQNPASPFASFAGHHVGVRVPDYDAAVAWYTEKLDFRVLQEWPYGDMRLAYLSPAADDDFHLELLAGPVEHPRPVLDDLGQSLTYGGYQHFCLRVASVDKARAELAARGVDVLGEPFRDRGHQPPARIFPRPVGQHDRTVRNPARRLTGAATDDRLSTSRWAPLADHGRGRGPKPRLHRSTAADTTRASPVALAPQNSRPRQGP